MDSLSLPWLDTSDLLDTQVGADDDKGEGDLKFPYFNCLRKVEVG